MPSESKSIIVTGAASGIGAAVVETLAAGGHRILAVDVAEERLNDTVNSIDATGERVTERVADTRDLAAMEAVVSEAAEETGSLDAIVACAGLADISSVDTGDPDRWREVLTVNALGPMVVARAALPLMLKQGFGDLVMVTSASGRITYVGEPSYVASKHAAVAFLDSLRKEVADSDIRVTSIEPGLVDTPMSRQHPFIDTILSSVDPLEPADIAMVVEFCISLPKRMNVNELVIRPTRQEL